MSPCRPQISNSPYFTFFPKFMLCKIVSYSIQYKNLLEEAWLLLTFFMCLHNQLSSTHSIVTYGRIQMLEKGDSSNRQKMNDCSFQPRFTAKIELVFVLRQKNIFYVNFRIQSECGKIQTRKNSVYGHFSHSVTLLKLKLWHQRHSTKLCINSTTL